MLTTALRWNDNDRHFGPFLFSRRQPDGFTATGLVLESNPDYDNDDKARCFLRCHLVGHTVIVWLPTLFKPYRETLPREHSALTESERYDEYPREFGVTLNRAFLQVFYGRQTDDSSTTRSWSAFLPWTETRLVKQNLIDTQGNEIANDGALLADDQYIQNFTFEDTDGAVIHARTYLRSLEYRRGDGWFKWLGYVTPMPPVRRILDIEYSVEVGSGKNDWKGGVLGCSIEAHPRELHESAFIRHCKKRGLTYPIPAT